MPDRSAASALPYMARTCTRCATEQDVSQFHTINTRTNKLSSWCKTCKSAWHREQFRDPKGGRKASLAAARVRSRETGKALIEQALTGKACHCGVSDLNRLHLIRTDGGRQPQALVTDGYGAKTISAAIAASRIECDDCHHRRRIVAANR